MHSFFSLIKVKRVLFACLVLFLMAGIFGGCDSDAKEEDDTNIPGNLPNGMVGKYVADFGDWFEIIRSGGTETIRRSDYTGQNIGYTGTVRFVSNYDSQSGVIVIEYTDTTAPNVTDASKPFHAIYYLKFTSTTAELNDTSDATREDWNADTATLNEAIGKFTRGKMGNYIDLGYSTPYTRAN